MPSLDTIRQITVQGRSLGVDKLTADMKALATAQDNVAQTGAQLATTTTTVERSVLSASRQFDALTRSVDPAARAQAALDRGLRVVNTAVAQGAVSAEAAARTTALLTARHAEAVDKTVAAEKATTAHGKAQGLSNIQLLEGTHVLKAFTEQVIAGQSPLQALALEGGRIATFFQMGEGGVGGTFKMLGGVLGGLLNPLALAAVGVAGIGAAGLAAAASIRSLNDQMEHAVSGAGRITGLSGAGLNAVAQSASSRTGVGLGDTRANAMALASTGKLSGANVAGVLDLTRGYAGAFGTNYSEAGKQLADIFGDPEKGAEKLNERLGFLDDRTKQYIRTLKAQGDEQGAVNALLRAATPALNEHVEQLGLLDRAWKRITDNNDAYSAMLGRLFSGSTPMDQYRRASRSSGDRSLPDEYQRPAGRTAADPTFGPDGSSDAAEDIRNASALRRMQEADVVANHRSALGADVVRATLPDVDRYQTLVDQQKALSATINDPAAMAKMGVTADQAHEALDRLNAGLATFQTTAQQITSDSALAVAGIQADTFAQKTAITYQKDYADTLQRTHDQLEAAATAEARRNEAIATANKQAEDAARQQAQSNALLGLRPAQALAVQRQQAIDNARRDSAIGTTVPAIGASAGGGALGRAPANVLPMIASASAATGMSPGMIAAIGEIENGFRLTGGTAMLGSNGKPSSAYGYGQLTNAAAADVARAVPGFNKYDANTAVFGSAEYLSILAQRKGGDLTAALNAYGGTSDYASKVYSRMGGGVAGTAYGTQVTAANDNYGAQLGELKAAPLRSASDALAEQLAAEKITQASAGFDRYGASAATAAGKIAEMNEKQALLNQYAQSGITIDADLEGKIDAIAAQYGDAAAKAASFQEGQERLINGMDSIRSVSRDALGTFVDDLVKGKSAGTALRDALAEIGQKMLSLGEDSLINGLFGRSGSPGGGLFGNLLSGLFGGGGIGSAVTGGIGHNAAGTDNWRGGATWVGENGPEQVILPRGSQVRPNRTVATVAPAMPAITMRGGDVIIQGNATPDMLPQIKAYVDAKAAETQQGIVRNFVGVQKRAQRYA